MVASGPLLEVPLAPSVDAWFTGSDLGGPVEANLSHHRPHVPDRLAESREHVARLTGTDVATWHLMRQVHGAAVAVIDAAVPKGAELRDVDVLVTTLVDRPLVVLTADCVPLLAAGPNAVGAAHAGWRGVVADVPATLVDALARLGDAPRRIRVALGPAIGPCCYEVGPEVVDAIRRIDPSAVTTTRRGTPSVDLRRAIRTRLAALGVDAVSDAGADGTGSGRPPCTACDPGWFSHRRDPTSGRQAGIVVRRPAGAGPTRAAVR